MLLTASIAGIAFALSFDALRELAIQVGMSKPWQACFPSSSTAPSGKPLSPCWCWHAPTAPTRTAGAHRIRNSAPARAGTHRVGA
ncbi:DUF2637 domain-containing protein [Nocardia farcinica]|uniref:DUF2637 domain-containing protein n=1 Tax=Nocardia farcinica TaxID=37329 RepID=UPI0037902768